MVRTRLFLLYCNFLCCFGADEKFVTLHNLFDDRIGSDFSFTIWD